jgi:hypothetical protein
MAPGSKAVAQRRKRPTHRTPLPQGSQESGSSKPTEVAAWFPPSPGSCQPAHNLAIAHDSVASAHTGLTFARSTGPRRTAQRVPSI